jgi:hypothetical protein
MRDGLAVEPLQAVHRTIFGTAQWYARSQIIWIKLFRPTGSMLRQRLIRKLREQIG